MLYILILFAPLLQLKIQMATMWIAIIPLLCLIFLRVANYAFNLPKVEVVKKNDPTQAAKVVITREAFEEPRFACLLCAIIGAGYQCPEVMVILLIPSIRMYLGWTIYVCATIFYFILGFSAGRNVASLWKTMKGKNFTSGGWIAVSVLIPLASFMVFLLYCQSIEGPITFEIVIGTAICLCISIPAILLGGCTSEVIRMPLLISEAEENSGKMEHYWSWMLFLAIGHVASTIGLYELIFILMDTWSRNFNIYCAFLLVTIILLAVTSIYGFLVLFHISVCSGKLGVCWWKVFFASGVPSGLFAWNWPVTAPLLGVVVMAKCGMVGIVSISFIYPLLFEV